MFSDHKNIKCQQKILTQIVFFQVLNMRNKDRDVIFASFLKKKANFNHPTSESESGAGLLEGGASM